jgi:hypothetical protein
MVAYSRLTDARWDRCIIFLFIRVILINLYILHELKKKTQYVE